MPRPRFSEMLVARRRQLGISITQASKTLKLKEQALIAFEEGDFENIPQSGYAQAEPERKSVIWSETALTTQQYLLKNKKINAQYLNELEQVLALDPRPAYQEDPERVYKMKFSNFDIHFKVNDNVITVVDIVEDTSCV